jgi:hypothetical protein
MRQDINAGRSLGPIYARLASANPRTPEEQWLMARLLFMCGRVVNPEMPKRASSIKAPSAEESRVKFLGSLAMDEPDREKRIAAYDSLRVDPCQDLRNVEVQRNEWRQMLEDAATGGELKARLDLVTTDIEEQNRARWKSGDTNPRSTVTAEQMDTIKQAIASGDPYAITAGARLLSISYANLDLRDGRGQALDTQALDSAANLIACDAGYPCGATNRTLAFACAFTDHCGATTLRDYTMYYNASPYTSQLIAQYEQALRNVVTSGDWSGFRFSTIPATTPAAALH